MADSEQASAGQPIGANTESAEAAAEQSVSALDAAFEKNRHDARARYVMQSCVTAAAQLRQARLKLALADKKVKLPDSTLAERRDALLVAIERIAQQAEAFGADWINAVCVPVSAASENA